MNKSYPNNIRCMKELDVQSVFQAVKSMLSNREVVASSQLKAFGLKK